MGTRAIVRLNGKIIAYTHWGGMPSSLGKDLQNLYETAKDSSLDYNNKQIKLNKEMVLGVCLLHQVDGTKTSNDCQEYEYDIRKEGVYGRYCDDSNVFVKLPKNVFPNYDDYDLDLFLEINGKIFQKKAEK